MQKMQVWAIGLLLVGSLGVASGQEEARLLRFPAIHGENVAFSHAGDLYTVSAKGGVARRLTSHDGYELFPRFSPDGIHLAFTGQYDGNTEVYVMPAEGGTPRRLTFTATLARDFVWDRMGPNNIVLAWRSNTHIIYRSRSHEANDFKGQLFAVPVAGGLPELLPLPRGGFCSFSTDQKQMVYNRIFREFRTWKRYRGGMADDIWLYDFASKKTEAIVTHSASDIIPMWHGDNIYFLSDRDSATRMNLHVYNLKTKKTRALTEYRDFDIKFPSLGDNAIVYENGGWMYRFDLATEKAEKIPVHLAEDFAAARGGVINVQDKINSFDVSPDGKRALFSARGDIFTVPGEKGQTRNLTRTAGVHDRDATWSPDGKWVAYISDAGGEEEIVVAPQDGKGAATVLTQNGDTYKYALQWSPDSKKLLWGDKKLRLQYVEVASKKITLVAQAKDWEITQYTWSPDNQWIAYTLPAMDGMATVQLYSLDTKKSLAVTDNWYESGAPSFSPDGQYLFLVSDRDFNPTFSNTEWNHAYLNMSKVYLVTLAKDTPSPFRPENDEVEIKTEEAKPAPNPPVDAIQGDHEYYPRRGSANRSDEKSAPEEKKPAKKLQTQPEEKPDVKADAKADAKPADKPKPKVTVKVDAEGIIQRTLALPIPAANYGQLTAVDGAVYYVRSSSGMTGGADGGATLARFDLAKRKETELGKIKSYTIAAGGKKMLVSLASGYGIIDLPQAPVKVEKPLDLANLEVNLDRHAEWQQIYRECWRQMRDFFYDPGMHGVDWPAVRRKYEPLLKHVHHRADLTYIIGEMIGELNAGHTYVGGGEMPSPKRVPTGQLGADLVRDPATGYYRVTRVIAGENWDAKLRSPLTEIGVHVHAGDYILAVQGRPTNTMVNIHEALVNTAGKQVVLRVHGQPNEQGSREVTVIPLADERALRYHDWVRGNIRKVEQATGGKVGYLHVPDMGPEGLNMFSRLFYPQLRKAALIVDVRGNGGGNVSPMLIERLLREPAMIDMARNVSTRVDPFATHYGPKVCLLDEYSASDGDLFPYRFRKYKLGKLIGKRSWGGVIGIRGSLPLLDGGYLNKPEFASFDVEGKTWIIEGHGVEPDIVVDNDPAQEFAGKDAQLERGIQQALLELKEKGKALPEKPTFPRK